MKNKIKIKIDKKLCVLSHLFVCDIIDVDARRLSYYTLFNSFRSMLNLFVLLFWKLEL